MPAIEFFSLRTAETPREILEADFPSLHGRLPIRGGWGYSRDDACIIDRDDPSVDQRVPFDGVGVEYLFAQYRLYEELIIFRSDGDKYAGIRHSVQQQSLTHAGDRTFDHIVFDIEAFRAEHFDALKAEWEGPLGHQHPEFDHDAHIRKRDALLCTGVVEYWFDITNFFGKSR